MCKNRRHCEDLLHFFLATFSFLFKVISTPLLFLFVFFNSMLPGLDVGTDFATFITLFTNHPCWATLTLTWMFVPFLIHLCEFAYNKWKKGEVTSHDRFNPMFHLPFVLPVRNLCNAYEVHEIDFGTSNFDLSNSAKVEAIQKEVGLSGLAESFFEAGPQSVTQFIIFLSTGNLSTLQMVSIIISILSLTWGASRAYFIQREEDAADPDPALQMVVCRVFPCMLIIVVHSLMMWIVIGGFLGPFSFVALVFNFLVVFIALKVIIRKKETSQKEETKMLRQTLQIEENVLIEEVQSEKEEKETLAPQLEEQVIQDKEKVIIKEVTSSTKVEPKVFEEMTNIEEGTTPTKKEIQSFLVRASLFAVWVPCVIGANPKMYCTSAITSMATKVGLLIIAITLAAVGLQEKVHQNHFLLWCQEEAAINFTSNVCSFTNAKFLTCFNDNETSIVQKIRICNEDEHYLRIYLLRGLMTYSLLAIAATYRLHQISNYEKMYKASKNILWCKKTTPIVHRSLIFDLIENNNMILLNEIVKEANNSSSEFLNRPNRNGDTPLDFACNKESLEMTEILVNGGAIIHSCLIFNLIENNNYLFLYKILIIFSKNSESLNKPNRSGDTPLVYASKKGSIQCTGILVKAGAIIPSSLISNLIENNNSTFLDMIFKEARKRNSSEEFPNSLNRNGVTPLDIACAIIHSSFIFSLIENDNYTFLDMILKEAGNSSTELLNRPNRNGDTLLDIACDKGFNQCTGILVKAGAKRSPTT